nr:FtsX-like permease family protein [Actinotalea subterranea]
MVAVALSVGALGTASGLAAASSRHVSAQIAASGSNLLTVRSCKCPAAEFGALFPSGSVDLVEQLPMVEGAGLRLDLERALLTDPRVLAGGLSEGQELIGATSGYVHAIGASVAPGGASLLDSSALHPAFVGADVAETLGVPAIGGPVSGVAFNVQNQEFGLAGVVLGGGLDSTVIVPYESALAIRGSDRETVMTVRVAMGAAGPVAEALPYALAPDAPGRFSVSLAADTTDVRGRIDDSMQRYVSVVGAVLTLIAALLIANAMIVSVAARTSEIGLRRAIGASQGAVMAIFVLEGAVVGCLGGLTGGSLALVGVASLCAVNGWTFALGASDLGLALLLGIGVGGVGAIAPAVLAARIDPATAVRVD